MVETPKRLKKNISFSEHELDIFEYLNKQKNASAFIKKLIRNQMILDEGIVSVQVVTVEPKKESAPVKTADSEVKELSKVNEPEENNIKHEETNTNEPEKDSGEDSETPVVEMNFTEEDLENKSILPEL